MNLSFPAMVARIGVVLLALSATGCARADGSDVRPNYTPYQSDGIYALDETVGWDVTLPAGAPQKRFFYVIRENNLGQIGSGDLDLSKPAKIETKLTRPGMVYVEITPNVADAKSHALGAAVAPEKIAPSIPAPADFDEFWQKKIAALRAVPINPVLTPKPSEKDGVDFAIVRLDHVEGKNVWGQLAKPSDPTGKKKFPALVIYQWASPPYPLQKPWVTDRAAEGWLALNIEPHDVMPDQPKEYYDALPESLKHYNRVETRNRDKNYFLYMYLADIRAIDYLKTRPDWDGKTIVVTGTSMGGQQSFCAAGLHPDVTAMIVHVPAGADANGTAHGRKPGYPNWDPTNEKELTTAQYFDSVNCAARITAPSLVSMGFIDTVTPPVGIWAAFNQIRGPKEAVPLFDAPHNHLATPEQQAAYTRRSAAWLAALVAGRAPIEKADVPTPRTDENSRIAHEHLLKKKTQGQIDVYFLGDSITRRWGTSDTQWQALYANWKANFHGWNAANFGWGADKTQHILWRLENGELDGVNPKVVVLMAGTNNIGNQTPIGDAQARADEVARGVAAIVKQVRDRAPEATVIVTGITPRNDNTRVLPIIHAANEQIAALADGHKVRYININSKLANEQGILLPGMSDDRLHFTPKSYQVWADALKPHLTELLGAPKSEDRAPPPTGDPSATKR